SAGSSKEGATRLPLQAYGTVWLSQTRRTAPLCSYSRRLASSSTSASSSRIRRARVSMVAFQRFDCGRGQGAICRACAEYSCHESVSCAAQPCSGYTRAVLTRAYVTSSCYGHATELTHSEVRLQRAHSAFMTEELEDTGVRAERVPALEPATGVRGAGTSGPALRDPLVVLFTAAILLNALLLFLVQPMFGKMVLPRVGGTPAIWNTCLLFFQGALLVGYLYARLVARKLAPRAVVMVHVVLLVLAALTLPIAIPAGAVPDVNSPTLWLLGVLTVSIGLPFTVLSAGS